MIKAGHPGYVTACSEMVCNGFLRFGKRSVAIGDMAAPVLVDSREQAGTRWAALGRGDIIIRESCAFRAEAVEMRGSDILGVSRARKIRVT